MEFFDGLLLTQLKINFVAKVMFFFTKNTFLINLDFSNIYSKKEKSKEKTECIFRFLTPKIYPNLLKSKPFEILEV